MRYARRYTDSKEELDKTRSYYMEGDKERKLKNALFIGAILIGAFAGTYCAIEGSNWKKENEIKQSKTSTAALNDLETRTADMTLK